MLYRIFQVFLLMLLLPILIGWIGNWNRLMKSGHEAYVFQDYDAAVSAFQEAAIDRPNNLVVHHNLGTALYKKGKFRQAANAFQTALLKVNVSNKAAVYYNLGNAQFQMRDLSAAIESYRSSLRLNPHDVDAKHNLALALQLLTAEKPNITPKQNENPSMQDSAKTEPNNLSESEINQLLENLRLNESRQRQKILKKQLNTGIRRAKDW